MTDAGEPKAQPSEIRLRILEEHQQLRELLDEIERAATKAPEHDPQKEAEDTLRAAAARLHEVLTRHLELEEKILVPALRDADGFGPARVEELLTEHEEQRADLEFAIGRAARSLGSYEHVRTHLLRLCERLREDMTHEEDEFLSKDLLRDDIIRIEFIG